MKRFLTMLLALLMIAGCALADSPLSRMYDAASELLFDTVNVTLTGEATFSLDGERFKTAEIVYRQDSFRSYWDLKLWTPRENGPERETGYTIIADGEKIYVMEAFYPGTYKTGLSGEQNTLLRRSVQLDLVAGLIRQLADQADTLLPEGAVTVVSNTEDGMTVRLQLGENTPAIVNTALNLAVQFAGKRWFFADPDYMDDRSMAPMINYLTPTQAILFSTKSYSVQALDVTFKRDFSGSLEQIAGSAAFDLHTGKDGLRTLETTFRLDVSDRGSTKVAPFDPAAFGVVLPEGAVDLTRYDEEMYIPSEEPEAFDTVTLPPAPGIENGESLEIPEVPQYTGKLEARAITKEEEAIACAKEIWALDYLQAGDLEAAEWEVQEEGDTWNVIAFLPGEAQTMKVLLRKDGAVLRVYNGVSGWEDAREVSTEGFETDLHDLWRGALSIRLMEGFAEAVNEGSTEYYHATNPGAYDNGIYYTGFDSMLADGDQLFMNYYTEPNEDRTARTRFVVQVLPVTRIVFFNTQVPVEEGGNG